MFPATGNQEKKGSTCKYNQEKKGSNSMKMRKKGKLSEIIKKK